ncbi:MAG: 50S ribosomal protein L17 [Spirochaetia bacterium]|nr:50S ribosomal protein L17 [Spirochaetia bacterium]
MRKRNKVKQLHRTSSHRKAMLNNMVTSLFFHEQIKSTVAKVKAARSFAEKLITRAKKNTIDQISNEDKIHNIRQIEKFIKQKEVIHKLVNDIGPRNKDRNGGYTRIIRLGKRSSDSSEMALLQLVDKKDLVELKEERKALREGLKKSKKEKTTVKETDKKDLKEKTKKEKNK